MELDQDMDSVTAFSVHVFVFSIVLIIVLKPDQIFEMYCIYFSYANIGYRPQMVMTHRVPPDRLQLPSLLYCLTVDYAFDHLHISKVPGVRLSSTHININKNMNM